MVLELMQEEPDGRGESGGVGLRALGVQPDAFTDASGGSARIICVQDGAAELGQTEGEDMHLRVELALASRKRKG